MSSLTITLIQTDVVWQNKPANLAMLKARINAIEEHTEIVVLPEMFSTGFTMQPELYAETMEGRNNPVDERYLCRQQNNFNGKHHHQ